VLEEKLGVVALLFVALSRGRRGRRARRRRWGGRRQRRRRRRRGKRIGSFRLDFFTGRRTRSACTSTLAPTAAAASTIIGGVVLLHLFKLGGEDDVGVHQRPAPVVQPPHVGRGVESQGHLAPGTVDVPVVGELVRVPLHAPGLEVETEALAVAAMIYEGEEKKTRKQQRRRGGQN
jgi:hypothetical protein